MQTAKQAFNILAREAQIKLNGLHSISKRTNFRAKFQLFLAKCFKHKTNNAHTN